jgi:flagellar basal body rod protein FlgC
LLLLLLLCATATGTTTATAIATASTNTNTTTTTIAAAATTVATTAEQMYAAKRPTLKIQNQGLNWLSQMHTVKVCVNTAQYANKLVSGVVLSTRWDIRYATDIFVQHSVG